MGINSALELVKNTGNQPVPLHLRNAPTQLMAELGYSDGYKYAHDYPGNFVEQQFLPDTLKDKRLWHAQHTPSEEKLYKIIKKMGRHKFDPYKHYRIKMITFSADQNICLTSILQQ